MVLCDGILKASDEHSIIRIRNPVYGSKGPDPSRNLKNICQWGGGGYFTHSEDFYLPSLRYDEGGQHPVAATKQEK
jgi:hypothetical protein